MRGPIRLLVCLFSVLSVAVPSIASAATKVLAWDQPAPVGAITFTSAQAAGYVYKYYVQGTTSGVPIPGVTCTTTNAALVKTCNVPLPNSVAGGTTITLTATDGNDESGQSNSLTITLPATPSNLRMIMQGATGFLKHVGVAARRTFSKR